MQVSVETTQGLGRKLVVSVPAANLVAAVNTKLNELTQKVKLDGFRPGKVPLRVVKQRFGAGVLEETAREIMHSSLLEALQQNDLNPAGTPTIEDETIKNGEDLSFTAVFEVFPEINIDENKVGIYSKLCELDTVLEDGDRVEIYRPLKADPKEARRSRALSQKTVQN